MNREARTWILAVAVFLILTTTVPYLLGAASEGGEWVFSGHLIGVEDGNSYIAKMLRGDAGDWLFRTPYSLSGQAGVPVFIPYLALGKLIPGRAQHEQLVLVFHLFRCLGAVAAVFGTYRFAARFLDDQSSRRWVTVIGTAGGGLGWLLLLGGWGPSWSQVPLVFLSPETFGFLGLFGVPHLALARGLLLLTLVGYLEALDGARSAWRASGLLLLTALVHPLSGTIGFAIILAHQWALFGGATAGGDWKTWLQGAREALGALALAAPYLLYLVARSQTDPFLRGWSAQNRIASPHAGYYVLAYGLLLPLAAIGARRLLNHRSRDGLLPVVWVLILPALIYAPVPVQRRLVEGGWVALATLAACGALQVGLPGWSRGLRTVMLSLVLPGTLVLLLGAARVARVPGRPAFLPADLAASYRWLADNAAVDSVVMASVQTGNSLPAWAPVRVPVGHGPESVPYAAALAAVEDFYAHGPGAERDRLVAKLEVDFVFVGPDELKLAGGSFVPGDGLDRVGRWGEYSLYRLERSVP